MLKTDTDRLLMLMESMNGLSANLNLLITRIKFNQILQSQNGSNKNLNILYMKWKSEVEQAQTRIEKIEEELNKLESKLVH